MAGTITITGHLTQDPKVETVQVESEDRTLCRFRVGYSINRGRNDRNFISVTTWGNSAINHAKWLEKGSAVRVDGELAFDTWESEDGTKQSRHHVTNADVEYLQSPVHKNAKTSPATTGGESF